MGYYLQTESNLDKADALVAMYGAEIISKPRSFAEVPANKALICVVSNGIFEAAGYCFSQRSSMFLLILVTIGASGGCLWTWTRHKNYPSSKRATTTSVCKEVPVADEGQVTPPPLTFEERQAAKKESEKRAEKQDRENVDRITDSSRVILNSNIL